MVVIVRACLHIPLGPLPPGGFGDTYPCQVKYLIHCLFDADRYLYLDGSNEYGPLITILLAVIKLVPSHRVVLCLTLLQAAMDNMEKQGASLANRPRVVSVGEIFNGGQNIAFAHVGDRMHR